ncbi:MAG: extracellular solute-binding protein [Chloroflexi bacterium]|nr:extracellular solute-binding protein [Chloroflexota bacterium]
MPNSGARTARTLPQALVTYRWQGDQYLIPYNEGPTNLIYYNVRIFDEAGVPYPNSDKEWTLDDLLMAAQELTTGEGDQKIWGYNGLPGMGGALNADWLYLWDARWWNEPCETESFIHEENAIKCMQWWVDLRLKHKVAPTQADLSTIQGNPFQFGRVAMVKGASWDNRWIKPNLKDPYDVAHGAFGPNGKRSSSTMGSAYAISKDCKHKEEAWEYMRAYLSTEGQIFNWSSIGIDPARWSAWPAYFTSGAVPPNAKVVEEAFRTYAVHEILDSPNGREISLTAQPIWDKAMLGEISAEEACKQITPAVEAVMKQNEQWCIDAGLAG